jgi:putative FmdB family regulatory protein
MPTYEYECPRCPRVFEVKQRITEPALVTCEVCGGPIHRLLSAAPFILKGEGWYVTDYPSESRKKAKESTSTSKESAGKESAGKESASKGDGGSAESKPATSSETKSSTDGGSSSSSSTTKPAAGTTKPSTGTTKPAAGKPAAGS